MPGSRSLNFNLVYKNIDKMARQATCVNPELRGWVGGNRLNPPEPGML